MEIARGQELKERPAKKVSFLRQAQQKHQQLFRSYVRLQGEFRDLEDYTTALQADAWKLTEQVAKQSWRNGIARGQYRAQEEAR